MSNIKKLLEAAGADAETARVLVWCSAFGAACADNKLRTLDAAERMADSSVDAFNHVLEGSAQ